MRYPDARSAAGPDTSGGHFLSRFCRWWRLRNDLQQMDAEAIAQTAEDVGVSVQDLRDLVARGPNAADLLYDRMRVLGFGRNDVERVAPGLMHDLERTCACCDQKRVCRRGLRAWPDDPAWEGYCPNAVGLTCVKVAKDRLPATA